MSQDDALRPLSPEELAAETGAALPAKEVMSLLDLNADLNIALDAAAPIDLGVAATLLAGSADGLVVVLAVKGLGRYAELRAPAAAERFIIGTLASALWAVACVGVAVLVRS